MQTMQALQVLEEAPTRITEPMQAPDSVFFAPSVGAIVHFVLATGRSVGQHRPALVTRLWANNVVNLQVFTDGPNDGTTDEGSVFWMPSVKFSEIPMPGTWHWPC